MLAFAVPARAADDSSAALNALVKARLAEEAGEPAAALSALATLASHSPTLPGLRGRMLEQAIEAGDLAAARSAAATLWQGGDRRFDAQLVLFADAVRKGDWKAAQGYLAGRADKTGADAISRLIQPTLNAWIDLGARTTNPERHLLAANVRARPEPALALEAALVQLAGGRTADAIAITDAITLTDRTSQLVALRAAATLDKAGEGAAAERLRKRIALASGGREDPLLLMPDQPVSTPRGGIAHWMALLADGFARTPNSSPKISLIFARSAYWLDHGDWTVRSALVEALDHNGQPQEAMALLTGGRRAMPPVLDMRRAELLADAGQLAEAAKLAESAAAQEPPVRSLLVRFADIARRSSDPQAAGRAYSRLEATLGTGDDSALRGTLLIARAELLLQAGAWDDAQPLLEKAVALRPDDAAVLNFAGYSALERRKDVKTSLARIEAAWNLEPQDASITDSLGWAYFLTGRVEEAVPLLEKAQRGEPDNPVIVEHLGDAYWQAGRRFQARYVWRAAALLAEAEMTTRLETKLRDGLTPATTAP
ncbi:Flp pilus assembly protein TadD [Sphingopyxis panaciterrae]|uniref:tetratricopeptide repeat protein n=1 Tax=Sphingopyxis panaciterrae TaxID=363841 RepID=UPI00141E9034|nr:tetratricopeptide repeat protein [Sphingopyxis panaciterrae]NIJ36640.1 Flp pilus assembly protein TadD [Sphingopyxis panaciterrae]